MAVGAMDEPVINHVDHKSVWCDFGNALDRVLLLCFAQREAIARILQNNSTESVIASSRKDRLRLICKSKRLSTNLRKSI